MSVTTTIDRLRAASRVLVDAARSTLHARTYTPESAIVFLTFRCTSRCNTSNLLRKDLLLQIIRYCATNGIATYFPTSSSALTRATPGRCSARHSARATCRCVSTAASSPCTCRCCTPSSGTGSVSRSAPAASTASVVAQAQRDWAARSLPAPLPPTARVPGPWTRRRARAETPASARGPAPERTA